MVKVALITGVTGQDGAYLAELLLGQGLRGPRRQAPRRRPSTPRRIDHLYQDPHDRRRPLPSCTMAT